MERMATATISLGHRAKPKIELVAAEGTAPEGSRCSLTLDLKTRRFRLAISRGETIANAAQLRSEGKITRDVNNGKVLFITDKKSWMSSGRARPFVGKVQGFETGEELLVIQGSGSVLPQSPWTMTLAKSEAPCSLIGLFHKVPYWSPATHELFGPDFNRASRIILVSAARQGGEAPTLPADVWLRIFSFFRRGCDLAPRRESLAAPEIQSPQKKRGLKNKLAARRQTAETDNRTFKDVLAEWLKRQKLTEGDDAKEGRFSAERHGAKAPLLSGDAPTPNRHGPVVSVLPLSGYSWVDAIAECDCPQGWASREANPQESGPEKTYTAMADERPDYSFTPDPSAFWMGLGGIPVDHSMIRLPDDNRTPRAAAQMWQSLTGTSPTEDIRRSKSPGNTEAVSRGSSPDTRAVASFFDALRTESGETEGASAAAPPTKVVVVPPPSSRRGSVPPPPPRRKSTAVEAIPSDPGSDSDDDLSYFRTGESPTRPKRAFATPASQPKPKGGRGAANVPQRAEKKGESGSMEGKFKKRSKEKRRKEAAKSSPATVHKSPRFQLPLKPTVTDDNNDGFSDDSDGGPPPLVKKVAAAAPSAGTAPRKHIPATTTTIVKAKSQEEGTKITDMDDIDFSTDDDGDLGEAGGDSPDMTIDEGSLLDTLRAQADSARKKGEAKAASWQPVQRKTSADLVSSERDRKESSVSVHYHFSREGSDSSYGSSLRPSITGLPSVFEDSSADERSPLAEVPPFPAVLPTVSGTVERTTVLVPRSSGLGLQLVTADGTTWISRIGKDSPAEECGQLYEGDVIKSINGVETAGLSHEQVLAELRNGRCARITVGSQMIEPSPLRSQHSHTRVMQDRLAKVPTSPDVGGHLMDTLYNMDSETNDVTTHTRQSSAPDPMAIISSSGLEIEDLLNGINLVVQPHDRFAQLVNVGPHEKERMLMWELTPHNDSIDFEVVLQMIGASSDKVVVPSQTFAALDGKVQGSLVCEKSGRYIIQFSNRHTSAIVSANFQCYLADMSPWLDPNSTPRRHGTVLRSSVLDISGTLDEVPLFNLAPFELRAIASWMQEKMAFLNIELIGKLQIRDDLMDVHEELEHRAQAIGDKLKAASASPTRAPKRATSPPKAEPEAKTVTINPVPLPESLSNVMRACIEYLAQPWALAEVGLFRVSGNKRKILEYIEKFDAASKSPGASASLADCFEPATVCGLLKMILQRERLPLSPWEGQNITSLVLDTVASDDLKVRNLCAAVSALPPEHSSALKCITWLFGKIIATEGNKMTASNLGISVGLTVFPTVQLQHCATLIQYLVDNFVAIWPEPLDALPPVSPGMRRPSLAVLVGDPSSPAAGAQSIRFF